MKQEQLTEQLGKAIELLKLLKKQKEDEVVMIDDYMEQLIKAIEESQEKKEKKSEPAKAKKPDKALEAGDIQKLKALLENANMKVQKDGEKEEVDDGGIDMGGGVGPSAPKMEYEEPEIPPEPELISDPKKVWCAVCEEFHVADSGGLYTHDE